ncbi:MAG: Holliday junction resolvase RuvX [Kiritimatiellales bacterium]
MGRVLGIDYGDVRIGIALSDETAFLASSFCMIKNSCTALDEIAALIAEHAVEKIVIGLPRNMDGSYGPATEKVRAFIEKLKEKILIPVFEWDERLSTVSAHNALREAGLDGKRRKEVVDKIAAQIILQNWLDAQ